MVFNWSANRTGSQALAEAKNNQSVFPVKNGTSRLIDNCERLTMLFQESARDFSNLLSLRSLRNVEHFLALYACYWQ